MDNVIVRHETEKGFELETPISLPKHYVHVSHTMDTSGTEFIGAKEEVRYQIYC